jgi:hypothetical protein
MMIRRKRGNNCFIDKSEFAIGERSFRFQIVGNKKTTHRQCGRAQSEVEAADDDLEMK